jgi:cell division septation protein DedD
VPEATAVAAAPVEVAPAAAPSFASVSFGPREEVVQRLPSSAAAKPSVRVAVAKVAPAAPEMARTPTKGSYFVQLGAYENAAVAKDAWNRAVRRNAVFAGQTPSGMSISSHAGTFYRLSVGGFARNEAVALCQSYKARGGTCFVRAHAGDQVALWARPAGRQMASR